jgi:hypothetical protein
MGTQVLLIEEAHAARVLDRGIRRRAVQDLAAALVGVPLRPVDEDLLQAAGAQVKHAVSAREPLKSAGRLSPTRPSPYMPTLPGRGRERQLQRHVNPVSEIASWVSGSETLADSQEQVVNNSRHRWASTLYPAATAASWSVHTTIHDRRWVPSSPHRPTPSGSAKVNISRWSTRRIRPRVR